MATFVELSLAGCVDVLKFPVTFKFPPIFVSPTISNLAFIDTSLSTDNFPPIVALFEIDKIPLIETSLFSNDFPLTKRLAFNDVSSPTNKWEFNDTSF